MTGQMVALRIEMALRGATLCATRFNEMPHVDRDDDDVIFSVDVDDNDDDLHHKMPTSWHEPDLSNTSLNI